MAGLAPHVVFISRAALPCWPPWPSEAPRRMQQRKNQIAPSAPARRGAWPLQRIATAAIVPWRS